MCMMETRFGWVQCTSLGLKGHLEELLYFQKLKAVGLFSMSHQRDAIVKESVQTKWRMSDTYS